MAPTKESKDYGQEREGFIHASELRYAGPERGGT